MELIILGVSHVLKKKLSLLFLLLVLPLVSSVQIDSGTLIQSNGLNTTLNFTSTFFTDLFSVETNAIYFERFRLTDAGTEYLTTNITARNMTAFNAPYISASSSTQKTISSNLSEAINATVVVNVESCSIDEATYRGNIIGEDSCSNGQATFTLNEIPNGDSILELSYVDARCADNTSASFAIIRVFTALAIAGIALSLVVYREDLYDKFGIGGFLVGFIAIIVGLVFFTQVAQTLGGVCT